MMMHGEIERAGPQNGLLTLQERAICEQIAGREGPHSQRALALLALDEGITQAQAGERAGLSRGQVKYWVAKFRKQRLSIFPDGLLGEPDAEVEEKPEKATSVKGKKAKKGKKGKGKKGKKDKRAKAEKTKKGKGTKKAKKKTGKAGKKKAKVKKAKK